MAKLILCTDKHGGIGYKNTIPWHSSEDFKHFRAETAGKIVIMGYNTWKSLPTRPLPGRLNIVLLSRAHENREPEENNPSVLFMPIGSLKDIIRNNPDAIVIGGSRVYEAAIQYCNEIIVSTIPGNYECDAFFDIAMFDYKTFKIRETKTLSDGVLVEYIEIEIHNEFDIDD